MGLQPGLKYNTIGELMAIKLDISVGRLYDLTWDYEYEAGNMSMYMDYHPGDLTPQTQFMLGGHLKYYDGENWSGVYATDFETKAQRPIRFSNRFTGRFPATSMKQLVSQLRSEGIAENIGVLLMQPGEIAKDLTVSITNRIAIPFSYGGSFAAKAAGEQEGMIQGMSADQFRNQYETVNTPYN
jgi:hypothetical protein